MAEYRLQGVVMVGGVDELVVAVVNDFEVFAFLVVGCGEARIASIATNAVPIVTASYGLKAASYQHTLSRLIL